MPSTPTPPVPPPSPPPTLPVRSGTPADHTRIQNATRDPLTQPSAAPQVPLPAGTDFGRYRLVDRLGEGGMGVVWKAWDRELHRWVALKQIRGGESGGATVERFLREARLAARLRHPGIVQVHDVAEHDGQPYFTAEWIDGHALSERPQAQLPAAEAAAVVAAVADALAFAHEQGVIHRDVKPANIILDARGTPFVTDFGLARESALEDSGGPRALTQSGSLVGTPGYMSPEQASGRRDAVGPAADQFSLGVMLYELLTGVMPFRGEGLREILNAISEQEPVAPRALDSRIPRDLETICRRALEKDPAARYASMRALVEDLHRFRAGEAIAARPLSRAARWLRSVGRQEALGLAAAAVILALAVIGAGLYSQAGRTSQEALDARQKGEAAEASARELLRKAALASKVLARWAALVPAVRELERSFHDSELASEKVREAGHARWTEVEKFLLATPPDSTSQSVARAFAGWARRLAGFEKEGLAWMREATALDPDAPYGRLMEALALFSNYVGMQPLPIISMGTGHVRFGPAPGEPAESAPTRRAMESLLKEAALARVWGQEGADDVTVALEAMRGWQTGQYANAEAALSRALELPDLRAFETDLRLARAQVRYLLGKLDLGREDFGIVLTARPGQTEVHHFHGLFLEAAAQEADRAGRDPREILSQAIAAFGEAIRRAPGYCQALNCRASAEQSLAKAEEERGLDPLPRLEQSIADQTEALRWNPEFWFALSGRAATRLDLCRVLSRRGRATQELLDLARTDLAAALRCGADIALVCHARAIGLLFEAEIEAGSGIDESETLRNALADLDDVVVRDPGNPCAFDLRSSARRLLAHAEQRRGVDPRAMLEASLADARAALELDPGSSPAWCRIGEAALALADLAHDAEQARADLRPAMEAFDAALQANPEHPESRCGRALAWRSCGNWEGQSGLDPRASYAKAIADYDRAAARNPLDEAILHNRGNVVFDLADAESAAGLDPRATLRRAIEDYSQALARNPENAVSYYGRGDAGVHLARAEAAAELDPRSSFEQARADLEAAVARNPTLWGAWANLGFVREFFGDLDGAIAAYEQAIRINPKATLAPQGLPRAHYNLACRHALLSVGKASKTADPRAITPEEAARERALGLENLEKAVDAGWSDLAHTEEDPDFEALRGDPRWQACLNRMRK